MVEYSIVIPAYNEESTITSSLTQALNFMNSFSPSYEIIVVDDGSIDNTVAIIEKYIQAHPQIRLIKNPHKGKGYTVRTGVLNSVGKYVLMADADMATPIEELKRLMVWIKDSGFDIVIASRQSVGAIRKNEPYYRHLMGRVFNLIIKILLLPGIQDTQCGFKVMKGDVAHDIFNRLILFGENQPLLKVARVTGFDVELLVIAKRRDYKIKEVSVTWTYGPGSKVHPIRDSISNLMDVLRIKWNDITGKYKNARKS